MKQNEERKPKMVDGYTQPQDVPVPNTAGYPEKDIKTTGVFTYVNDTKRTITQCKGVSIAG